MGSGGVQAPSASESGPGSLRVRRGGSAAPNFSTTPKNKAFFKSLLLPISHQMLGLLQTSFSLSKPSAYTNEDVVVDQDGPN